MKYLIVALTLLLSVSAQAQSNWSLRYFDAPILTHGVSIAAANDSDIVVSCSKGLCFRSMNGGRTWDKILDLTGSWTQFLDIAHPTPDLILLVKVQAGAVLRSSDGGKTWQQRTVSTKDSINANFIQSLKMLDAEFGVCVLSDSILERTTDGGITWSRVPLPSPTPKATVLEIADRSTYLISNYNRKTDRTTLYRTTNGGVTWDKSLLPWSEILDITMVSPLEGFAVGYDHFAMAGKIYKTTDAGMNWDVLFDTTMVSAPPNIVVPFRSIDFYGRDTGYVVGSDGCIMATTNRGLTWQSELLDVNRKVDASEFRRILVAGPKTVIAIGDNRLLATRQVKPLLPAPVLIVPEFSQSYPFTFNTVWQASTNATHYQLRVSAVYEPDSFMIREDNIYDTNFTLKDLRGDAMYLGVRAINGSDSSNWFRTEFLTVWPMSIQSATTNEDAVWPNPVSGNTMWIKRGSSQFTEKEAELQIVDNVGRVMVKERRVSSDFSLDVTKLPKGAYRLMIIGAKETQVIPFIRN